MTADKPVVNLDNCQDVDKMSKNERIKRASQGLFYVSDGKKDPVPFGEEVAALTRGDSATLSGEAKELSKFHGIYMQWNREDKSDYFFMVRVKNPAGGELTPSQWVALDEATERYGDGTLRLSSRQSLQFHHIYGTKLVGFMKHLNEHYLDHGTLSACGDVNRNVMCSPIDGLDPKYAPRGNKLAHELAEAFAPRASSYAQIWIEGGDAAVSAPRVVEEPLYGDLYLPRKFKIGIGHPKDNSVDLLTHDVGLMPVVSDRKCDGELWDFYSGGGLGFKHGKAETQPYLGVFLGRIRREQIEEAVRAIVILQRDHGHRKDRQQARWKYTIRRLGVENVKEILRDRFEIELTQVEPQPIPRVEYHHGWHAQKGGKSYYGMPIAAGRLTPKIREGLRVLVEGFGLGVRFTPAQDLLLCGIEDRDVFEGVLAKYELPMPANLSQVRRNIMACPALPTCGLAMTEAERVVPSYCDAIEAAGLGDLDVVIRMTGCPNNCVRPVAAEIGVYGFGKNAHVLVVGGSREGTRIAKPLYDKVSSDKLCEVLVSLLGVVKIHCPKGENIGDFLFETDEATLRDWVGVKL